MIALLPLLQIAGDVKDIVTIKTVSAVGVLLLFITYLMWQNHLLKKDIVARDKKIGKIVAEHTQDLKDGTKDMITLVNKYHQFVQQLSSFGNNGNNDRYRR
jgi:cell division protein FtsB